MNPGEILGDRYRLVARLGQGGTAVVWRAVDQLLGREVAVKLLTPQAAGDTAAIRRIRTEARAAARFHHPHVVGVYDIGEVPGPDGPPVPYLVLELVEGRSVSELLRDGPLPCRDALRAGAQVAAALAAVHARGVVHRDVKPDNVMLTDRGAKLVDFGISATAGELDLGPDRELLGTPAYLAPERLEAGPVRPACDVYGLGLLLYKSLTGALPWPRVELPELLAAHRYAEPAALPWLPGLPPEVAELYHRCLAKSPADRPTSAEAARVLAAAADAAGAPQPAGSLPLAGSLAAGTAPLAGAAAAGDEPTSPAGLPVPRTIIGRGTVPTTAERWDSGRWPRSRRRTGRVLAMAGLVLAVGVLGLRPLVLDRLPAGPGAAGPDPVACQVQYEVRQDSGGRFVAGLTLTNSGTDPVTDWRLAFAFPAEQQIVGSSVGEWQQSGRSVTVEGTGRAGTIPAEDSMVVELAGRYRGSNPLPTGFRLNGADCTYVLTAVASATEPDSAEIRSGGPPEAGRDRDEGNSGRGHGNGDHKDKGKDKDKDKDDEDDEDDD